MADKYFQPGDRWTPSAKMLNDLQRVISIVLRGDRGGAGALNGDIQPCVLPIKNGSDAAIDMFGILEIDPSTLIIDPSTNAGGWAEFPAVLGITPTAAGKPFAVLLEPAATGKFARGVIAGAVTVSVDVTDESHGYADLAAGDTAKLASAPAGPARIVWKQSGTGTKLAIVVLGSSPSGFFPVLVKMIEGSPGDCDSYASYAYDIFDPTDTSLATPLTPSPLQPQDNAARVTYGPVVQAPDSSIGWAYFDPLTGSIKLERCKEKRILV